MNYTLSESEPISPNPLKAPWRPLVVRVVGGLFGPVAGALVTYINLRRLGSHRKASWTLWLSLAGSVLLGCLAYFLDDKVFEQLARAIGHGSGLFLYPALQQIEFDAWRVSYPETRTASAWSATGWGLLGAPVFLLLFLAGSYPWMAQEHVEGIEVNVTGPSLIKAGEEFALHIQVSNSASEPQRLECIELDTDFLSVFEIKKSEPPIARSEKEPFLPIRNLFIETPIPAGGDLVVTLHGVAKKSGDLPTKLGVCIETNTNCVRYNITVPVKE